MEGLLGHRLCWFFIILFVLAGFVPGVLSMDICGPEYYQLEKNFATKDNIDQLKEAFFPENNVPPLQIIINYTVTDHSMPPESPIWAWMWNPVYVFCGARFLAEFGLGLPVISMRNQMMTFSKPFIKVKEITLNLTKLTNETSKNACIRKLTSLVRECVCSLLLVERVLLLENCVVCNNSLSSNQELFNCPLNSSVAFKCPLNSSVRSFNVPSTLSVYFSCPLTLVYLYLSFNAIVTFSCLLTLV